MSEDNNGHQVERNPFTGEIAYGIPAADGLGYHIGYGETEAIARRRAELIAEGQGHPDHLPWYI